MCAWGLTWACCWLRATSNEQTAVRGGHGTFFLRIQKYVLFLPKTIKSLKVKQDCCRSFDISPPTNFVKFVTPKAETFPARAPVNSDRASVQARDAPVQYYLPARSPRDQPTIFMEDDSCVIENERFVPRLKHDAIVCPCARLPPRTTLSTNARLL